MKPSKTSEAGYRYYTKDDLVKLQQIIVLKKLGFKLSQIKEMTRVSADNSEKAERWKEIFKMEIEKIREKEAGGWTFWNKASTSSAIPLS